RVIRRLAVPAFPYRSAFLGTNQGSGRISLPPFRAPEFQGPPPAAASPALHVPHLGKRREGGRSFLETPCDSASGALPERGSVGSVPEPRLSPRCTGGVRRCVRPV